MEDTSLASCTAKLLRFRIKELKDVLSLLGLSKQGKKQDLVERIKTILSDEQVCMTTAKKRTPRKEVVRLIEDTFCKMKGTNATDLANTGDCLSDNNIMQTSGELAADHLESELKTRCICENSSSTESMIKCDDKKCGVWQHLRCVILPDEPGTGCPDPPETFYCEICRLSRADPFLLTLAHPLNPVKLVVKSVPVDRSNPPLLHLEKAFHLTRADKDLLSKQEYDVQAWCMLVNDKVIYRMQWPQHAALCVNGMPVRATNRPGSQVLGSNGRDDGPIITPCIRDGLNKISLEASDARTFCLGVRLIKRCSFQQIRNLVPKESDGESIEEALARVRRCIGGGASSEESDCDNELVVIAESHVINLRCPMSGSRIKVAGRFRPCVHLGGFDLDIFLEMNQRSRKWQCPICLQNYSLENIIIDPYFNRIVTMMQNCSDEVTDVEIKPDGCWRVKTKNESERKSVGDLACWHFSNGSRCNLTEGEDSERMEMPSRVKQENGNSDVLSDLNLHEDSTPMSINASGSSRNEEDRTTGYINSGTEYDSVVSLISDPAEKNVNSYAEVIELSDSDDDDLMIVSEAVHDSCPSTTLVSSTLPNSDIPALHSGDQPSKEKEGYDTSHDIYEVSDLGVPFVSGSGCNTGLFNSSSAVSASGSHIQHTEMNGSSSTNGDIAPATSDAIAALSCDPISFRGTDPSFQTYLQEKHNVISMDYEVRDQMNVSNGSHSDDWVSPRPGDCQSVINQATTASKELDSTNQKQSGKGDVDPMEDEYNAALLLKLGNGGSDKTSGPRSDFLFSCPKQNRSVRRRTYMSVDSD